MKHSRRSFLSLSGGVFGGFLSRTISTKEKTTDQETVTPQLAQSPLYNVEPVDTEWHYILELDESYEVMYYWWSYHNMGESISNDTSIPFKSLEDLPKSSFRNHFKVYEQGNNSSVIKEAAERFEHSVMLMYGNREETFMDKIIPELVRSVQFIKYESDIQNSEVPFEYPQYPAETLYLGVGDCEDTTFLLASMLENLSTLDVRKAVAVFPSHTAVLAAIPDMSVPEKYEEFTTIDGVPYTLFETTQLTEILGTPDDYYLEYLLAVYQDGHFKKINYENIPKGTIDAGKTWSREIIKSLRS